MKALCTQASSSLALFPGFPSSRFSHTASDGKLEGKPGNKATSSVIRRKKVSVHTIIQYTKYNNPVHGGLYIIEISWYKDNQIKIKTMISYYDY